MAGEKTPQSIQSFLALVPIRPKTSHVIPCTESSQSEAFFRDFTGARITGLTLLRYKSKDMVALSTDDKKVIGIVAEKGAFIAVEKRGEDKASDANLAFRDDIRHSRIDLVSSYVTGDDVMHKDGKFITGETVEVDPSADFAHMAFEKGLEIKSVTLSWWTKDWFTVRSADKDRLVVRADRNQIIGAVAITPNGIDYLKVGESGNLGDLKLTEPPFGTIPSKITS